ncbi:MAG: NAD-dependent epimerase/dehydratase family protein [Candidatus Nanopelagicales bacterium]
MSLVVVTGSGGLIGSSAVRHFAGLGLDVIGIDNDMRAYFFGPDGSTAWNVQTLRDELGRHYRHESLDIRDRDGLSALFRAVGADITLVVHTAAQPSHDWAAKEPWTDFDINAVGTLNMLEVTRLHAPDAVFIYTSTNKVYGDTPNSLPLIELDTRWEIAADHAFHDGITEDMSIDRSLHSVFGAAKVAGDVMVQEYGRYFDIPTACFRGGTLTGPIPLGSRAPRIPRVRHAMRDGAADLHGVRLQGQAGSRRDPQQ